MSTEYEVFEAMMHNNLNLIATFHNHAQAIFKEKQIDINTLSLSETETQYWSCLYANNFPYKITETSFLLMFGHFEEMLYLLHQRFNPQKIEIDRGYGFLKYKAYISSLIDISSSESYQLLNDAQKIRNSILHISGRISLSKQKNDIEDILKKTDLFIEVSDRVLVTKKGLKEIQKAIRDITHRLLNEANSAVF